MILDVSKIEYKNFNERDVEVPALLSVLGSHKPVSVLDAGAHYSWYTYAPKVRELIPRGKYEALDLVADAQTAEIVDRYHTTDLMAFFSEGHEQYGATFSISVLEHVGIQPIRVINDRDLRKGFLDAMLILSDSVAFLTFPFGAGGWCLGECIVVADEELVALERVGASQGFASECQFFYNPFPQGREKWVEVSRDVASAVPLEPERGCTCVCLLLFTRTR